MQAHVLVHKVESSSAAAFGPKNVTIWKSIQHLNNSKPAISIVFILEKSITVLPQLIVFSVPK